MRKHTSWRRNVCGVTMTSLIPGAMCVFADLEGYSVVYPHFLSQPPPGDHLTTATSEEHGIWGVILFVLGVTCSNQLGLSATVWKFIGETNSSLIVIPSGEQSVSPAECWRGDRLLQDDNWKESGWSSLGPPGPLGRLYWDAGVFWRRQITECYIWRNDYVLLGLIWQT